jgi:hypothetical protein
MFTVHHLDESRSQGILWLLEELGFPYEIRRPLMAQSQRLSAICRCPLLGVERTRVRQGGRPLVTQSGLGKRYSSEFEPDHRHEMAARGQEHKAMPYGVLKTQSFPCVDKDTERIQNAAGRYQYQR